MTRRIYIAGHAGLLGGALTRRLRSADGIDLVHPTVEGIDLRDEAAAHDAIAASGATELILVAGRVGGLGANLADPVGFLEDNLRIQLAVLRAAFASGIERLLFISSANAYPADAPQPIIEQALGTGAIDPGTAPYGLAKYVGVLQCDSYRAQHGLRWHSVLPCNLYGPGDRFDPGSAHVVAASLTRFADAVDRGSESVSVWGSGRQRRQLMYVDDLAAACDLLLTLDEPPSVVNAGPRDDVAISELSELAAATVGYQGAIEYDSTRPEGVARRLLDTSLLHDLGWAPQVDLKTGLRRTWEWRQGSIESPARTQGAAT